ncbi:branched-chain amino acid ABC transporter permease [Clostridium oryzae]|nr:branched-chain amino acid ABC transporter permease [Clostridium oryzae]
MRLFSKKNIINLAGLLIFYIIIKLLISAGIVDYHLQYNLYMIGVNIILAVGLNLITGYTGQFSLGHAAFMSVGAYTGAVLTSNLNMPFIAAILAAAAVAAIAGVLIGIPTLRLRGDYLAIATLGFGEILRVFLQNANYVGGAAGFNDIPLLTNWTWSFVLVVISVLLMNNFIKSYHGRACIAIREDEIASEAMGVNTTFYKVLAFSIGAALAGIAGALHAHVIGFIKPDDFGFMKSIDILVMVVFGGLGSTLGAIIGAVAVTLISLFLQDFSQLRMVIYAVILFLIMVYRPQGLLGKKKFNFFKKGVKADASTGSKKSN